MIVASLHLAGSLAWWQGLLLAALFAGGTWWLYRRETTRENRGERLAWLLPVLRIVAVVLLILMLTGPIVRHRKRVGDFGRVLVFVDASQSMTLKDEHMDVARKLLIAQQRGWLSDDDIDTSLAKVSNSLLAASRSVLDGMQRRQNAKPMNELASSFKSQIEAVREQLGKVSATSLVPVSKGTEPGNIAREYWLNMRGDRLSVLLTSPRLSQAPNGRSMPDVFESPSNVGDEYGQRLRGYLLPPVDGDYVFWIASDDESVLYLSTDESSANKQRIAQVNGSTGPREWLPGPSQSTPIPLRGGKRYYVEVLHKEGSGADHLAVGWQLPIGAMERPIPGHRLAPYVESAGGSAEENRAELVKSFETEVLFPVNKVIAQSSGPSNNLRSQLPIYATVAERWASKLRGLFSSYAQSRMQGGDRKLADAIAKVEQQTRWQRVQASLLETNGFLATLAERHDVELLALREGQAEMLWWAGDDEELPNALPIEPIDGVSDLSTGLHQRVRNDDSGVELIDPDGQRVVAVVISDGQHNLEGSSPQMTAAMLGDRRIPVFAVGTGALNRPEDLAVQGVDAPQTVFHDDRVKGEVILTDDMPSGQPFNVTIKHDGQEVFSKRLVTDRSHTRRVPFDFSIKELVGASAPRRDGVRMINVPLDLQVSVSKLDGEAEAANNEHQMVVHAITEPRKVLMLDGRPRWETRYLRNLFDRDKRWSVNALAAGTRINGSWARGDNAGQFPPNRESLFGYDLIVLGDVKRSLFRENEIEWLHDYVNSRGGGLVILDGRRGHLREFAETKLGDLIPIDWLPDSATITEMPVGLKLSAAGSAVTSLQLVSDSAENAALWTELDAPHWVAPVKAHQGAETWMEAQLQNDTSVPVIVYRGYGAGKVIYLGMDESWRWRFEVADLYHARFWNQLAKWAGEQPFAVQDAYAKLDAGKPVYKPGDKAEIRARLRDRDGKPLLEADVIAELFQDGKKVASIPLQPDANKGGVFRANSPLLTAGNYEVGLVVAELDDVELKAKAKFKVEDNQSLEKRELVMNETLLQKMAQQSGGQYFREENMDQLIKVLEPLSHGKIVESETELWRSYWWFVPIMLLLTFEWALRKRAGML